MISYIVGIPLCIIAALFVYVGVHIQEENRQNKQLPFFWERGRKPFDKSDIKYRDGDNT